MVTSTAFTDWRLDVIERTICNIIETQLAMSSGEVTPESRLIEDLHIDSLEIVELIMTLEETFNVALPSDSDGQVYKAIFARQPFRLCDLAELVYVQRGSGKRDLLRRGNARPPTRISHPAVPFSQLGGRFDPARVAGPIYEPLEARTSRRAYRRRTDGMRCFLLPAAKATIGDENIWASPDEQPLHEVALDAFLIDAEPVSSTAYARFLNSIGSVNQQTLREWFILADGDRRHEHCLVECYDDGWRPRPGTERLPMILVSWYGANAYSLWANGFDWRPYRAELEPLPGSSHAARQSSYLPGEAQWEYAARGASTRKYPWGDDEPGPQQLRCASHLARKTYRAETLPMAPVNDVLGMSPFGLHHMAGNVWQWCRDWYAPDFYDTPEARMANAENRNPTGVRSERGGSWIGPAALARSSYRRARPPMARGRCLGFRCIGDATTLT